MDALDHAGSNPSPWLQSSKHVRRDTRCRSPRRRRKGLTSPARSYACSSATRRPSNTQRPASTVNVLARLFRGKMLAMLMDAHDVNQLTFFNTHAGLADKRTFKRFIAPLRRIKWVVYCKAPFAGPEQVLRYLSRYSHRNLEPPPHCSRRRRHCVPLEGLPRQRP